MGKLNKNYKWPGISFRIAICDIYAVQKNSLKAF